MTWDRMAPCAPLRLVPLLVLVVLVLVSALDPALEEAAARDPDPEAAAREYLRELDHDTGVHLNRASLAEWAYASNLTEHNLKRKLEVSAEVAAFQKEAWHRTVHFPWQTFRDPDLRRQFRKYSVLGSAALPPEKFEKLEKLTSEMESIYSTAKICDYFNQTKCDLSLEPDLVELLTHSRDANELRHAWVEWRRASGEKCRGLFERYVALSNEAAALNNFTDMSEMWLEPYEAKDFRDQVRELWEQLRPLYEQLHAYVRRKLQEQYGEAEVSRDGPIPAHLLGEMWSSTWKNVANFSAPAVAQPPPDVSPALKQQGYTPLRIFKLAEEFFISLNMSAMPDLFWERSILEKPADREITCHASAWDFYDAKDFRIKQCTRVDMEHMFTAHHEMGHIQYFLQYKHQPVVYREGANPGAPFSLTPSLLRWIQDWRVKQCTRPDMKHLLTAHHEMGHVQYYLQYKHQPVAYRRGANPGFHEAVGDVMSLSVSTPKHLRQVGLLRDEGPRDDDASALNYLFLQALQKVAFLPYAYLMDLWRWDVFNGSVTSDEYNCRWWRLREQYQGIEPPVDRTEEDFDPGAKYHIVASVPYIRYFVSYVIQFQFHRALCLEAGQFDPNDPMKPLYACDIYGSTAAGNKLKAMLQLGSSRPWPEALEAVTGSRRMDASGLLDYFKPLYEWLKAENARTGERVGWGPSRRACVSTRDELERLRRPDANKMDTNKMEVDKMVAEKMGGAVAAAAAPEAVPEVAAAAAAAVVPEAAAPAADAPVPAPAPAPAPAAVAAPSDSVADEVVPAAEAPVDRR